MPVTSGLAFQYRLQTILNNALSDFLNSPDRHARNSGNLCICITIIEQYKSIGQLTFFGRMSTTVKDI
jgi:hypothetical protein